MPETLLPFLDSVSSPIVVELLSSLLLPQIQKPPPRNLRIPHALRTAVANDVFYAATTVAAGSLTRHRKAIFTFPRPCLLPTLVLAPR